MPDDLRVDWLGKVTALSLEEAAGLVRSMIGELPPKAPAVQAPTPSEAATSIPAGSES